MSWVEASRYDAGTAYAAFDRHTFGDMTPWVYRTTDFGKTWTRIVSPDKGVRGYAHVIKEDTVQPRSCSSAPNSACGSRPTAAVSWAQFKGGNFPASPCARSQVQPRDGDLVIATHGRGIWIIDDLSPLRALTKEVLARRPRRSCPGGRCSSGCRRNGGWAEGDATLRRARTRRPARSITYYLRARHVFGPIKLEVLDAEGKVIDTLAATKRRGINRVVWSMQVKPPRVPRAAQIAYNSTQGPRVVPGTYTVRLTRGGEVVEKKLAIGLDRRAPYTTSDRKAQFDAAMQAHALFGDMSGLTDRIDAGAARSAERARRRCRRATRWPASCTRSAGKLEESRSRSSPPRRAARSPARSGSASTSTRCTARSCGWEGRPARYQVERLDALRRELDDVAKELDAIVANDIRPLDAELQGKGLQPIPVISDVELDHIDPIAMQCVASRGASCGPGLEAVANERD